MPLMAVTTNADPTPETRTDFLRTASAEVSAALGKSESYVMVTLDTGRSMLFGGSDAPTACVRLMSLGLTEEATSPLSQRLCGLLESGLGIPPDRVYIEFGGPPRAMWGWNGKTFG